VPGSSTHSGEEIILYVSHNGPNQRWFIQDLSNNNNTNTGPFIHPSHLVGINNYIDDAKKCFFCWRWFKRDGVDFRIVTLEEGASDHHVQIREPYIRPLDLVGTNGYSDNNIANTNFCWRWFKRDNVDFRVLTIENDPKTHALNPQFTPLQLQGINGYENGIAPFKFCWRWFKRENVDFRLVTLEEGPANPPVWNENTTSANFYISCWVKYNNFNNNYPQIATSATNAFQLHGLGPVYGGNRGRLTFYLQTPDNVGPHGRGISGINGGEGEGWVGTSQILTTGQWYFIEVEKGSNYIKFGCNGEVSQSGLANGVNAQQFVMKQTGNILVKKGTGDLSMDGEVKDFVICQVSPPTAFQKVVSIKTGDRFNYGPWGGECVVEWHDNDLWLRRTDANFTGTRCWKTQNGDGVKLIQLNQHVNLLWDNTGLHEAYISDANTINVLHGTTWYTFTRIH